MVEKHGDVGPVLMRPAEERLGLRRPTLFPDRGAEEIQDVGIIRPQPNCLTQEGFRLRIPPLLQQQVGVIVVSCCYILSCAAWPPSRSPCPPSHRRRSLPWDFLQFLGTNLGTRLDSADFSKSNSSQGRRLIARSRTANDSTAPTKIPRPSPTLGSSPPRRVHRG